jgi:NAD+ synthetase
MKIAIAQIGTIPGKIQDNKQKVLDYAERAKAAGAELVVFPELTLTGYAALDLFLKDDYVAENINAIRQLAKLISGIKAIVGFVDIDQTRARPDKKLLRYNSAVLIEDGKITAVRDKSLLPEYDIFMEKRYFATSRRRDSIIINGKKVGLQICEDIMTSGYPINLIEEYAENGVDLIINMSASPFAVGKISKRVEWLKKAQSSTKAPVIYVNTAGVFDGYEGEVVFDGRSMFMDQTGVIRAMATPFKEDLIVIDTESSSLAVAPVESEIRVIHDALVFGISEFAKRVGFKKAVLGLSGGIDSAVVAALAVEAFGADNVDLISMPTEFSSKETRADAAELANNLKAKFIEESIQPVFQSFREIFKKLPSNSTVAEELALENVQSRIRGAVLMGHANKTGAMLLNTGNKTELSLGYCTLYGDMNGALAPLGDLSKNRVYDLADFINSKKKVIPDALINRPPTAELKPGQTDEIGLGFPYKVLSPLCEDLIESDQNIEELRQKYSTEAIDSATRRIKLAEFKRRQAPPAIRITEKSFGVGRRIPLSY